MAGSGRGSSTFAGNGSGDHVFNSAEFFLCRRNLGHVLARLDLGQHRLRYKSEEESAWTENGQRGLGGVEGFRSENAKYAAAESWPPAANQTSYYLKGTADTRHTGGLIPTAPTETEQFSTFVSDPSNPVRNPYECCGAHDHRQLQKRGDVLTFDSAVLTEDTELTGPVKAQIYVSCDCRDLDLWVRLLDVFPDGTAFNLMSPGLDLQRASYRDLKRGRQLLNPEQIYDLTLDRLITSNVFKKGHRMRVQISGGFFPNFSRNPQNGDLERNSSKVQKANIRIYHDAERSSEIVLALVTH